MIRLTFSASDAFRDGVGLVYRVAFNVHLPQGEYHGATRTKAFVVELDMTDASDYFRVNNESEVLAKVPGLRDAMTRLGLRMIEDVLAVTPWAGIDEVKQLSVDGASLPRLAAMLDTKSCSYQLKEGRDLYCAAPDSEEETIGPVHLRYKSQKDELADVGGRRLAVTSPFLCGTCGLPDDDYLCSHLIHPRTKRSNSRPARDLISAHCALGKPDKRTDCRAGGNGCWERLFEAPPAAVAEPASPLAIHESLDYLGAVWLNAFGVKMFRATNMAGLGKLSHPCRTASDFDSHLVALGEVLKSIEVDDSLLDPQKSKRPPNESLNRLESAAEYKLMSMPPAPPDSAADVIDRLRKGTALLRAVTDLRNSLAHATSKIPSALATLGLPFPMPAWPECWDQVRAKAVEALGVIRTEIQNFVT